MEKIIVSRHPAAIEFICGHPGWETAPVVAEATAEDVVGKAVAGNLPLWLAAKADTIWAVEFDGVPPRGQEYGVAEMRAAGARLTPYTVSRVEDYDKDLLWRVKTAGMMYTR